MNEKELLYVKTVAETKSISKAAKRLFISQPSLSQSIQKIEEDLGAKLFARNIDGMKLTLVGEKYYLTAKEILNIYSDFKTEVSHINDLKKGRITFGITGFMATHLLPILIPEFASRYPNVEIYVTEENSAVIENCLKSGMIDFAIMHTHPSQNNTSVLHKALFKDPFLVVTKKNHPISQFKKIKESSPYPLMDVQHLKGERFILLEKDKRIRQISDLIFSTCHITPNICLTVKNFETARRLSSTGFGMTLIPMQYAKIFEGRYDADYYVIDNPHAYWETCVSIRHNTYLSKASEAFIDLIYWCFEHYPPI